MSRFEALPDALRLLRESRNLSQRDVAEALGVEPSVISGWERGRRQPSMERLGQLADLFELDLGDLDDALELAGGAPARPRAEKEPSLDPHRLAKRLLNRSGSLPLDPVENELAQLLEAVMKWAERLRTRD